MYLTVFCYHPYLVSMFLLICYPYILLHFNVILFLLLYMVQLISALYIKYLCSFVLKASLLGIVTATACFI